MIALLLLALAQPPEDTTRHVSAVTAARHPYRVSLLFDVGERTPGDAVMLSGLARDALTNAVPDRFTGQSAWLREFDSVLYEPLAEVTTRRFETVLKPIPEALALHERSARATLADWSDYSQDLLKYGVARPFADRREFDVGIRLFAIQARWHLKSNRPEEALRSLRVAFSLARHFAQCPDTNPFAENSFAVEAALDVLEEIQSHPTCPSLADALDRLPRPLLSIRAALEGTRLVLVGSLPRCDAIRRDPVNTVLDDDAMQSLGQSRRALALFAGRPAETALNRLRMGLEIQRSDRAARAAMVAIGYPEAVVKATPALNAALLHGLIQGERTLSQMRAALELPYGQATQRFAQLERENPVPPTGDGEPALSTARLVISRCSPLLRPWYSIERRLATIRVVEAIRLHGKPPVQLADVGYVPIDPLTGRPFVYADEGGQVVLESPEPAPGEDDIGTISVLFKFRPRLEVKP